MATKVVITDEERRAAFQRCRTATWPEDYDEAVRDTVRQHLVETIAHVIHRERLARTPGALPPRPALPPMPERRPPHRPAERPRPWQPGIDLKRLAAGDRDD